MLSTYRKEAIQESLLLMCPDTSPTERHYKAAAAAHGVSSQTARRATHGLYHAAPRGGMGLSARAALDSLVGLDPRVIYRTEPAGSGWWPDMEVLEALAAQPTLFAAHERLQAAGRSVPTYEQFCRRLKACLSPAYYAGICRTGGSAATAMFEVYVKRAAPPRMHVVEMDAFELPIDVTVPRRSRPRKPWLLMAIDRGSRAVPAWLVLPGRPTAADARTLLALMVKGTQCPDGTVIGGVPWFVMPDNGGEFGGWEFTGSLSLLNIERLPVPPSTPHLKGTVERMGQYVEKDLVDGLPGATHGPQLRHGEEPWRAVPPMALAELEARIDRWFTNYNTNHKHSALRGRTPLQAWLADPEPVRQLSEPHLLRDLMPRVRRTGSKKGVLLDYVHYIHPSLGAYVGVDVDVAWLPRQPDRVEVFTVDNEFLCSALDSSGLSEAEAEELMTGRLRRGRAVAAASHASVDLRARLAQLDAPVGPLPRSVVDHLADLGEPGGPTPDTGPVRSTAGTSPSDLLVSLVLGDES